jgi:hypothetical protein
MAPDNPGPGAATSTTSLPFSAPWITFCPWNLINHGLSARFLGDPGRTKGGRGHRETGPRAGANQPIAQQSSKRCSCAPIVLAEVVEVAVPAISQGTRFLLEPHTEQSLFHECYAQDSPALLSLIHEPDRPARA